MNLSQIAFRFRPVLYLIVTILMLAGAVSYFSLPAREDPEITIREAIVTTTYPGLSAERIEQLVTRRLEEAIRRVAEVEEIRSLSLPGASIIHVEAYDRFFDLDQIWDDMRHEIELAQATLPDGTNAPVIQDNFGDVAVVTAALTSDDWPMNDMFDMAQHIRDQLYSVSGTKRVDILGVQEERIFIETSEARLGELGINTATLIRTLQEQNIIRPGGEIDTGQRSFVIEPTGNYTNVDDIRETLFRLPNSSDLVALQDLAQVYRAYVDPPVRKAYFDGEPALILSIVMLSGQSVLDYGAAVKAKLDEINATLPIGYELDIATFQADQVEKAVYGVTFNVLQTLGIVLAVVIVFLGLRTGLIVGAIVPAVMLSTIAIMGVFGMDLERMSLATLVIALGLLVDNGIVIAEDFMRRVEDGVSRDDALKQTGGELALPLLSSTLTTILVFLPLMLSQHVASEYARSISLVVLIALLASWVLAMTLTPNLCHSFIKTKDSGKKARFDPSGWLFRIMSSGYEVILRLVMRIRIAFLVLMLIVLGASVVSVMNAPQRFFPDSDRTQALVYVTLPSGVSTRTTDAKMQEIFQALEDRSRLPAVESFAGYVGFGGPRFVLSLTPIDQEPNKGFIVVNVDGTANMDSTIETLRALFAEEFSDIQVRVARMFLGPSDSTKLEVQVKGPDADYIYNIAERIEGIFTEIPGAIDISQNWQNRVPKIVVEIDQNRARRAGVSSTDIAQALSTYFSGTVVSEFREGDEIFPIVARGQGAERADIARLRTLPIQVPGANATVPLIQVADIGLVNEFASIHRENLFRTVTIEASNLIMTAEDMVPVIAPRLDELRADLAPGHTIEFDGVVAQSAEARAALLSNMPLTLGVIIVLLVTQFNSYRRPAIILLTIPLVLAGVALGLTIMQADFGLFVILGIFSLAGIIINNAIVLIDRIDIERQESEDAFEAIVSASVRRLRPILMTTVTTILGLLPLIIARDPLFYGMSSVIAFGLLVGTIMTLGVVPILYSLLFGIQPSRKGTDKKEATVSK